MAYNEALADRIKDILEEKRIRFTEKKMFGGLCFLVDDKMLLGVEKNRLMARIDPEDEAAASKMKGVKPMDFTGRVMKGFLFVDDSALDKDGELEYWVGLCLKYNPKAKSKSKAKAKAKAEVRLKAEDKKHKAKSNDKIKIASKTKTAVVKTKARPPKKAKA
ncbi:MAG TPA: TfoX/Sxy family protein [Saprospiraceae bacterium]|nr:TfoX/Sxy family protein [Saprospiraceae bacterium]